MWGRLGPLLAALSPPRGGGGGEFHCGDVVNAGPRCVTKINNNHRASSNALPCLCPRHSSHFHHIQLIPPPPHPTVHTAEEVEGRFLKDGWGVGVGQQGLEFIDSKKNLRALMDPTKGPTAPSTLLHTVASQEPASEI